MICGGPDSDLPKKFREGSLYYFKQEQPCKALGLI